MMGSASASAFRECTIIGLRNRFARAILGKFGDVLGQHRQSGQHVKIFANLAINARVLNFHGHILARRQSSTMNKSERAFMPMIAPPLLKSKEHSLGRDLFGIKEKENKKLGTW